MNTSFTLRCPSIYTPSPALDPPAIQPLSLEQHLGRWYITYTSSPDWRDKRNVLLTYSLLNATNQPNPPIDDLITYQNVSSARFQSVHGTDTPSKTDPWAWTWRGNGFLKIASSHWEILGHGKLEDCGQWMVVYAQKSIFSPASINVYTREKHGLPEAMLESIKATLADFGQDSLRALVESMYSVQQE